MKPLFNRSALEGRRRSAQDLHRQMVLDRFRQVLAVIVWAAQWCPRSAGMHLRHEGAFFNLLCMETTALMDQIEDHLAFEMYR